MAVAQSLEHVGKAAWFKKTAIAGGILAALGFGVAKGDPIQHTMNAAQETLFGTDQVDNELLGTDLRFRDFISLPFNVGVKSTVAGILTPKDNVASMFSGRSFNSVPFNYLKVDQEQVARINRNAALSSYTKGGEPLGYSDYPNSTFPQRMTNRSWDSASGDIVLGSYNLRRG